MNWEVRTMRSVTSCFNSTLYRKNLSRFWPIWALYSVIWLFALPLNLLTTIQRGQNWALEDLAHSLDYFSRVSVGYSLNLGTVLAVIFGLLAAMAVFSYLDASRSACMMHALPLRREALFFTNYLSGLSFLLLPNAAIFGLTLAGEAVGNCLDLKALAIWLLVQSASCLFFYSFAVFCAMFTGHLLALPVFYGVLNCLAAIISALMDSVLYLFLYGYNGLSGTTQQAVAWLTPLEKLGGAVSWTQAANSGAYQLAQPAVVAVYAGVGVALSPAAPLPTLCCSETASSPWCCPSSSGLQWAIFWRRCCCASPSASSPPGRAAWSCWRCSPPCSCASGWISPAIRTTSPPPAR